jgi:hypothetical protein
MSTDLAVEGNILAGVETLEVPLTDESVALYKVGDRINLENTSHNVTGRGVVIGKNTFNLTMAVKVYWSRIPKETK